MKARHSHVAQQAKTLFQRAMNLHAQNNFIEAKSLYLQVLKLMPKQPDALHMLGVISFQENDFENAVRLMSEAYALIPNHPTLLFNLGNAQRAVGNLDAAENMYLSALKVSPKDENIEILKNLGNVYKEKNNHTQAIAIYDQLLVAHPDHAYTLLNKAVALLSTGHLHEGWPLYEARLRMKSADESRAFERDFANAWDGRKLDMPLLVLPEQGLGDQIFYGAMLSDLEKLGMEATVCMDGRLIDLFSTSFKTLNFIQPTDLSAMNLEHNAFGAQIHLASLGQFFRTKSSDFENVPCPYLFADTNLAHSIKERVQHKGKLVCGLSWDSKHIENGRTKRMALNALLPALQLADVTFIDLQYGDTQPERQSLLSDYGIDIQHFDDVDNFYDINGLAALIDACDVVVSVSNSTAHLAAALGKPTLLMLPHHSPLWYWHLNSMTSPWYPSVTLLRQQTAGDWQDVVGQVSTILRGLSS